MPFFIWFDGINILKKSFKITSYYYQTEQNNSEIFIFLLFSYIIEIRMHHFKIRTKLLFKNKLSRSTIKNRIFIWFANDGINILKKSLKITSSLLLNQTEKSNFKIRNFHFSFFLSHYRNQNAPFWNSNQKKIPLPKKNFRSKIEYSIVFFHLIHQRWNKQYSQKITSYYY